jgi:hypothetical protein
MEIFLNSDDGSRQGRTRGGGCRAAAPPPQTPENRNVNNTDFVDMISKVLHNFSFSRNQLLKSATELSHGTCIYVFMYINAVANSVMLYLHDFYNIIFNT